MARPLEHLRVLLVEDDPIIALHLWDMLEGAGAVVLGPAHEIAGALAILENTPVDIGALDNLILGGNSLPIAGRDLLRKAPVRNNERRHQMACHEP